MMREGVSAEPHLCIVLLAQCFSAVTVPCPFYFAGDLVIARGQRVFTGVSVGNSVTLTTLSPQLFAPARYV